jgi:hypothetical protein
VQPGHSKRTGTNLNSEHAILRSGDVRSRCPSSYALSAPACPPNTRDKLRASNMLNARLLHPLVRRPRRFTHQSCQGHKTRVAYCRRRLGL